MATDEVSAGPITRYAVDNIRRLRAERRWSFAELEDKLKDIAGHSIRASGLHRLENGRRRVDIDDLVAFALTFEVSPATLLLPPVTTGTVDLTAKPVTVLAEAAWAWIRTMGPLWTADTADDDRIFAMLEWERRTLPPSLRTPEQHVKRLLEARARSEEPRARTTVEDILSPQDEDVRG